MAQMLIAALVIAGWLTVYLSLRNRLRRGCADLRADLQREIDSLSEKVVGLERSSAALRGLDASKEISLDTLAAISRTVTDLFGKRARIRSVKLLQTSNVASQWAQQGRVMVQASHNLTRRGREL
jgi:hypothetical protein